jgi:hypothetical protein
VTSESSSFCVSAVESGTTAPESWGLPSGSSKSGTGISGRLAKFTGVTASVLGPAFAGATEITVSAAQMSNAVRSDGNMKSAVFAVNDRN